jgi:crotonobetainyl-CoA:carnitine CoA-transferase CaiB-like acyl-CoA transferase
MPNKVGVPWIDVMAGMTSAIGLLLALLERRESGRGQYIDLSLFDVGIWAMIESAQTYLETGEVPTRQGAVHRNFAPSQPFECSDGWIMLAIGKDVQFERFCNAVGLEELAQDPRYKTNEARLANRTSLIQTISSLLAHRTRDELLEACNGAQVPASPINNIAEVLHDRQSEARNAVWTVAAADGSRRYLANALRHMSLTKPAPQGPAPLLGQHTVEILRRELAMRDDEVRTLVADRVVVDGAA